MLWSWHDFFLQPQFGASQESLIPQDATWIDFGLSQPPDDLRHLKIIKEGASAKLRMVALGPPLQKLHPCIKSGRGETEHALLYNEAKHTSGNRSHVSNRQVANSEFSLEASGPRTHLVLSCMYEIRRGKNPYGASEQLEPSAI